MSDITTWMFAVWQYNFDIVGYTIAFTNRLCTSSVRVLICYFFLPQLFS